MTIKPLGKFPKKTRAGETVLALAMAAVMTLQAPAEGQQITDIQQPPWTALEARVEQNHFGPLVLEPYRQGNLDIHIDGPQLHGHGRFWLVEPGLPVRLRAELTPASQETAATRRGGNIIRQTAHEEFLWEGETDDRFAQTSGGWVEWRAGTARGRASYVTVSAARLVTSQSNISTRDVPTAAILRGSSSILLLSGVAYDRAGDGMLFDQNIGIYPDETAPSAPNIVRDNAHLYRPPITFYRIDDRSREARVNEHMTLGNMFPPVFEDDADKVRYVAISPRLLEFLPALYANMEEAGLDPQRLAVLRAYVSPTERLRLERAGIRLAQFTRYQYGDALALVYTEETNAEETGRVPPRMSDLNGNGNVGILDAEILGDIVKRTMDHTGMYGGLGIAASFGGPGPSAGTPYVHLDLRGFYSPFREE